jgi:hypothetical protein
VRTHYLATGTGGSLGQIRAALAARFGRGRVAGATVVTVDVGAGFGLGNLGLIGDEFGLGGLFKLDIIRLWQTATGAGFLRARIFDAAIGTGPLQFDVADSLLSHGV